MPLRALHIWLALNGSTVRPASMYLVLMNSLHVQNRGRRGVWGPAAEFTKSPSHKGGSVSPYTQTPVEEVSRRDRAGIPYLIKPEAIGPMLF